MKTQVVPANIHEAQEAVWLAQARLRKLVCEAFPDGTDIELAGEKLQVVGYRQETTLRVRSLTTKRTRNFDLYELEP